MLTVTPCPSSEKTKVEVVQGDITDYSSVLEASRGADLIVHMASLVDVWHRIPESLIYSVNIKGEAHLTLTLHRADGENRGGREKHPFTSVFSSGKQQSGGNRLLPGGDFQGLPFAWDLDFARLSLFNVQVNDTAVEETVPDKFIKDLQAGFQCAKQHFAPICGAKFSPPHEASKSLLQPETQIAPGPLKAP